VRDIDVSGRLAGFANRIPHQSHRWDRRTLNPMSTLWLGGKKKPGDFRGISTLIGTSDGEFHINYGEAVDFP